MALGDDDEELTPLTLAELLTLLERENKPECDGEIVGEYAALVLIEVVTLPVELVESETEADALSLLDALSLPLAVIVCEPDGVMEGELDGVNNEE